MDGQDRNSQDSFLQLLQVENHWRKPSALLLSYSEVCPMYGLVRNDSNAIHGYLQGWKVLLWRQDNGMIEAFSSKSERKDINIDAAIGTVPVNARCDPRGGCTGAANPQLCNKEYVNVSACTSATSSCSALSSKDFCANFTTACKMACLGKTSVSNSVFYRLKHFQLILF